MNEQINEVTDFDQVAIKVRPSLGTPDCEMLKECFKSLTPDKHLHQVAPGQEVTSFLANKGVSKDYEILERLLDCFGAPTYHDMGAIHFTEFVQLSKLWLNVAGEESLITQFMIFDSDHDGSLSKKELDHALTFGMQKDLHDALTKLKDSDSTNIQYDEFIQVLGHYKVFGLSSFVLEPLLYHSKTPIQAPKSGIDPLHPASAEENFRMGVEEVARGLGGEIVYNKAKEAEPTEVVAQPATSEVVPEK